MFRLAAIRLAEAAQKHKPADLHVSPRLPLRGAWVRPRQALDLPFEWDVIDDPLPQAPTSTPRSPAALAEDLLPRQTGPRRAGPWLSSTRPNACSRRQIATTKARASAGAAVSVVQPLPPDSARRGGARGEPHHGHLVLPRLHRAASASSRVRSAGRASMG
jgi:hypothetical protein